MSRIVYDLVIIGGGASGLFAAGFAARSGCRVLVLEQKEKAAKKIYATGNGKCNFTNRFWSDNCFRSTCIEQAMRILSAFSLDDTLSYFHSLGILPSEKNGYFYPNSEQAASIAEVLLREIDTRGVKLLTGQRVIACKKEKDDLFCAETTSTSFFGRSLLLATGGKASPVFGSDGSGYLFAKQFGHSIVEVVPAIVQLKAKGDFFSQVAGVRLPGRVTLHSSNGDVMEEGELLLTEYGLSGIPVMQVSRYAAVALARNEKVIATLDFLPGLSESEVEDEVCSRFSRFSVSPSEAMLGLCNNKLNRVLLQQSGIDPDGGSVVSEKKRKELALKIKHFSVQIIDTNGFQNAQACAGGVPLSELTVHLESKLVKGLFLAGELTDVDGTCGGYNLQWAWSSGAVTGKEIGGRYASNHTIENRS